MALSYDRSWMWHPSFTEDRPDTSGLFVDFRRTFILPDSPPRSLDIQITADTRYKLYVNHCEVAYGPVKGDHNLWFFDEVDIGPYLKQGHNSVSVRVLRLFYATNYAPSFPRLPSGGLRVKPVPEDTFWQSLLGSSTLWESAIDYSAILRIDEPEDAFLHVYESVVSRQYTHPNWVPAMLLEYKNSTGNAQPWNLSPRLIPSMETQSIAFLAVHNVESALPAQIWEAKLVGERFQHREGDPIVLPAGTRHRVDLEMEQHTTAFIRLVFRRPVGGGSVLRITYSEGYEDSPSEVPWIRRKTDRCDFTKDLYGPSDVYEFGGIDYRRHDPSSHDEDHVHHEYVAPFHWRTFRFIRLSFEVASTDLALECIEVRTVNYPLDVRAELQESQESLSANLWERMWSTSIRTLRNCMHDCYEDCPFYEQLQYAMDTRSSALFTYLVSGDDRLARQAIIQLHNSFQARMGLTASRAPSHRQQYIPHFSLYWICLVSDHYEYFADKDFTRTFTPVIDAVLSYFDRRIGERGLVMSEMRPGIWNYVDWTQQWKPHGIPPAIQRTQVSTFTNQLYVYTLKEAAKLLAALGRPGVADEYNHRADKGISALLAHCFDGKLFSDTIADGSPPTEYSQHCQIWAVLSGAVMGRNAQNLLRESLEGVKEGRLVQESVSMSFYTLRAISLAGGSLYDDIFHQFWKPWQKQLEQNVTTWVEDDVSQRSDCHAWGSTPIFELIVEVIGVRPLQGSTEAIEFRPRTTLFPEISVTVPLPTLREPTRKRLLRISWQTEASGNVAVRLEFTGSNSIAIFISALNETVNLGAKMADVNFIIKADSVQR